MSGYMLKYKSFESEHVIFKLYSTTLNNYENCITPLVFQVETRLFFKN